MLEAAKTVLDSNTVHGYMLHGWAQAALDKFWLCEALRKTHLMSINNFASLLHLSLIHI